MTSYEYSRDLHIHSSTISHSHSMEESNIQDILSQDIAVESLVQEIFIAPSIHQQAILRGASYTHHSAVPENVTHNSSTECVLGVDEAGRGPVLGNRCNPGI